MISYSVDSSALQRLEANMRKYPALSKVHFGQAIVAATVEIHKKAIRGIVPWKTGTLVRTFSFNAVASQLMGKVFPTRDYALYVHEGTRPHVIMPKNKKALWWMGARHPMRSVRHPGTAGNPFLPRMVDAAMGNVNRIFERAGDRINQEIGKL